MEHLPVLKKEVLRFLNPKAGDTIVDCTLGLGGHALALLPRLGKDGLIIGFDLDEENLDTAKKRLSGYKKQAILVHKNFRYLTDELLKLGIERADGILLDLGLCSSHVDDPERGFSFREKGVLCMRYDRSAGVSAYDVVNSASADKLAEIFREYGEERHAVKIAKAVAAARKKEPIKTTEDLAEIIRSVNRGKSHIDPATRVFQALRVYVNDEIGALKEVLPQAVSMLRSGGRLVVVSYHSLEDRIVKHFFKKEASECVCPKEIPVCVCGHKPALRILTKKPITPAPAEIAENRRARSAKLRAAEKI